MMSSFSCCKFAKNEVNFFKVVFRSWTWLGVKKSQLFQSDSKINPESFRNTGTLKVKERRNLEVMTCCVICQCQFGSAVSGTGSVAPCEAVLLCAVLVNIRCTKCKNRQKVNLPLFHPCYSTLAFKFLAYRNGTNDILFVFIL